MVPHNTTWIITDSDGRFIEAWTNGDKVNKRVAEISKQIAKETNTKCVLRIQRVQLK